MEDATLRLLLVHAVPVLLAVTLHEAAHGYAARLAGDDTAARAGRISLNPLRHIDPVGTVLMPLALYIATRGAFTFGYARPVPVNFAALRGGRPAMAGVAFAGPAANLLQAVLWLLLASVMLANGLHDAFMLQVARAGVLVNLVMFAFNLFPLPPLDGGHILMGLLPQQAALQVARVAPYGFFIVAGLLLAGIVDRWWMLPIVRATQRGLRLLQPASFDSLMMLRP